MKDFSVKLNMKMISFITFLCITQTTTPVIEEGATTTIEQSKVNKINSPDLKHDSQSSILRNRFLRRPSQLTTPLSRFRSPTMTPSTSFSDSSNPTTPIIRQASSDSDMMYMQRSTTTRFDSFLPDSPGTPRLSPDTVHEILQKTLSTQQLQEINDSKNDPSILQKYKPELSAALEQKARTMLLSITPGHSFDASEQEEFVKAMQQLTTKQKQSIIDAWLQETAKPFQARNRTLQMLIAKNNAEFFDADTNNTSEIDQLNIQRDAYLDSINQNNQNFHNACLKMIPDFIGTLSPSEIIVNMIESPDQAAFEIMDMKKINPTQPIQQQYNALIDKNIVSTHISNNQSTQGRITPEAIAELYSSWLAGKIKENIKIDQKPSVSAQITRIIQKFTGHTAPFSSYDSSLRNQILSELPENITAKLSKPTTTA